MISDGLHDIPAGNVAMVVTHLQMTTPADLRDVANPPELRFEQLWRETAAPHVPLVR